MAALRSEFAAELAARDGRAGERIAALEAELAGLRVERTATVMEALLGVPVSAGFVARALERFAQRLAAARWRRARNAPAGHLDVLLQVTQPIQCSRPPNYAERRSPRCPATCGSRRGGTGLRRVAAARSRAAGRRHRERQGGMRARSYHASPGKVRSVRPLCTALWMNCAKRGRMAVRCLGAWLEGFLDGHAPLRPVTSPNAVHSLLAWAEDSEAIESTQRPESYPHVTCGCCTARGRAPEGVVLGAVRCSQPDTAIPRAVE